jgi:preprotein translocase subunit SecG
MLGFVTVLHVILCVLMIFVILLQPGKDAGMGAALGGGAATSAFGGRGAVTFLTKLTAICAALFFLTSLSLSFVGLRTSVVTGAPAEAPPSVPAPAAATEAASPSGEGAQSSSPAAPAETPAQSVPAAPPAAPKK